MRAIKIFSIFLTILLIATGCNQNQSASFSTVSPESNDQSGEGFGSSYQPIDVDETITTLCLSSSSNEEKVKVIGLLEKYLIENNLAGLPLFDTSAVNKLPLNTCDSALWEQLFGENGSVISTPKEKYWKAKPMMSNSHFLHGLNYSLNRAELVTLYENPSEPLIPSVEVLGEYYKEIIELDYFNSDVHKQNLNYYFTDRTDEYGYSFEDAKESFILASNEMIQKGFYKAGDTVHIELALPTGLAEAIGNYIETCFESAFNVPENPLTLSIDRFSDEQSNILFKKLMTGQYDIGFGHINGGSIRPYDDLGLYRSDNETGFTVNWGEDTNQVSDLLTYNGIRYSYDALLDALIDRAFVQDGQLYKYRLLNSKITKLDNGGLKIAIQTNDVFIDENNYAKNLYAALFAKKTKSAHDESDILEIFKYPKYDTENKAYVYEITPEELSLLKTTYRYNQMLDIYCAKAIDGQFFGDTYYKSDGQSMAFYLCSILISDYIS